MAPPFPNPFTRKQPQGGGGKEGPPSGGGLPPVGEPPAGPTVSEATPAKIAEAPGEQLSPLAIALNEADTAFSPFMDDLESTQKQNPAEPFFVRFGWAKGEKDPKSTSAQDKGAWVDSRIILLIAPDAEGSFTLITRQEPKEIKPKDAYEAKKIQDIIDYCSTHRKNSFRGGFNSQMGDGKANLAIGYDPVDSNYGGTSSSAQIIHFDPNLLPVPSAEAVIASIQESRVLAHAKSEEKSKPLRDAQEQARKSKEAAETLSGFLKNPPQPPPGEGTAGSPPILSSDPTA